MDPEKKKTIVVGALFVAMLGIGAFQFTKGGAAPEPPKPAEAKADADGKEKSEDGKDAKGKGKPKNPMYAGALPARDPFQPAAFSVSKPEPATPVAPSAPIPAPKITGGPTPSLPNPLVGELPPMSPGGPLPGSGIPGSGLPGPAPRPEPTFEGTLIGVLVGTRSAAVFRIGSSERIVPVGGEIEPGVRLLSVRARRAVVRFHGKTLQLNLKDEAPSDKAAPTAPPASSGLPSSLTPPATAPTLPEPGPSETSK